jgi:hypothetical protein
MLFDWIFPANAHGIKFTCHHRIDHGQLRQATFEMHEFLVHVFPTEEGSGAVGQKGASYRKNEKSLYE